MALIRHYLLNVLLWFFIYLKRKYNLFNYNIYIFQRYKKILKTRERYFFPDLSKKKYYLLIQY